ncbi:MAG: sulfotransferase [Phycisphaerales bacterium]|nr:MAG: sulfotransferase [Phycisphaerales bacterium]
MCPDSNTSAGSDLPSQPIFIQGILPRCGTNFLLDLLRAHPDCGPPEPVWEDFFLYHADLLVKYVDTVYAHWNPRWGVDEALRRRLCEHLGGGLVAFLAEKAQTRRMVTKTPRVDNLDHFFTLFPNAHLVILVRDGRAVIESGVKTFKWHRESALRKWAQAARTILDFDRENKGSTFKYRIVRYEDLWSNLEEELRRLLLFLDLDPDRYDFEEARRLPVRGSSTIRDQGDGVHWAPVKKGSDFDPMSRWRHWSRARHERFNWVAGRYLERFGYQPQRSTSTRFLWTVWNLVLDVRWLVIRMLAPLYRMVKRRLDPQHPRMASEQEATAPTKLRSGTGT